MDNLTEKLRTYSISDLAEQLSNIDSKIKQEEQRFKALFAPAKQTAEAIRDELLRRLAEGDQSSIKFDKLGLTIVRAPKTSYSVSDPVLFERYVKDHLDLSMFGSTLIVGGVNNYKENNEGELPPGVSSSSAYVLSLRNSKKED